MPVRKTDPIEPVGPQELQEPEAPTSEESSPVDIPQATEFVYAAMNQPCPDCGDKLRTDNSGFVICSVNAKNCPRF